MATKCPVALLRALLLYTHISLRKNPGKNVYFKALHLPPLCKEVEKEEIDSTHYHRFASLHVAITRGQSVHVKVQFTGACTHPVKTEARVMHTVNWCVLSPHHGSP